MKQQPATAVAEPPESDIRFTTLRRRWRLFALIRRLFLQVGEMGQFTAAILSDAVRHPSGYWGMVRNEAYLLLKLCWFPLAVSTFAFGLGAPGIQGVNVFSLLGIPERLGSFFVLASVREFGPWVTAVVVAGVVGSAYTSDLGSRRIRDEIDAMEVLGIDSVRELVLPRVLACIVMTALLDILGLTLGIFGGLVASVMYGADSAAYLGQLFANATTYDVGGSFLKTMIFGLIIAVVCCYKGLKATGGPIGVGRAVNQAVVISFLLIFIVNDIFDYILLGLFPQILVYR